MAGFELEAWLLDHAGLPSPVNEACLRLLNDPLVVPELSRFNVELNAPPVEMRAGVLARLDESLLTTWEACQRVAHGMDAVLAMIGIPPTIRDADLCLANMSAMNHFAVLNAQVLQQRGGAPIRIPTRVESAARVVLRVQLLHAFSRHMGIDLRRGDVAVAEQHLYHAQIGAMIEQMRREGVPQRVR